MLSFIDEKRIVARELGEIKRNTVLGQIKPPLKISTYLKGFDLRQLWKVTEVAMAWGDDACSGRAARDHLWEVHRLGMLEKNLDEINEYNGNFEKPSPRAADVRRAEIAHGTNDAAFDTLKEKHSKAWRLYRDLEDNLGESVKYSWYYEREDPSSSPRAMEFITLSKAHKRYERLYEQMIPYMTETFLREHADPYARHY